MWASSPGWRSLLTIASWSVKRGGQSQGRWCIIQHSHTCGSHGDHEEIRSLAQLPVTINLKYSQWIKSQCPDSSESAYKCVTLLVVKFYCTREGVLHASRLTNEKQCARNFDVRKHSAGLVLTCLQSPEDWCCCQSTMFPSQVMSVMRIHPWCSQDFWNKRRHVLSSLFYNFFGIFNVFFGVTLVKLTCKLLFLVKIQIL